MPRGSEENVPHMVDCYVGRRVCEKRISLGYNQSDLGRALGITFQQVQKYEKGANRISASKLWEIARFFNVDVSYFFEGLAELEEADKGIAAVASFVFPITLQSIEIGRLAPRLPARQQKLVLEMVRGMAEPDGHDD